MESNFDKLRNGEPVKLKNGLTARVNKENKTLQLSNGYTTDISHRRDMFPETEEDLSHVKEKEKIRGEIDRSTFGKFGFQLGQSGFFGAAKDWAGKLDLTQTGDQYVKNKRARGEVSEEIRKTDPYKSLAATGTSLAADVFATRGLGTAAAGAVLPAIHAGPRIFSEPGEVAKESALGAGAGFLLGKAEKFLGNVAARRGASREVKKTASEIPAINAAGKEATAMANREQQAAFGKARAAVENENSALLHQHQLQVNSAKERAISAKNSYEKAKFDRENDIFLKKQALAEAKIKRTADQSALDQNYQNDLKLWKEESKALKEQADLAERQYQEALKSVPKLQREAQEAYGKDVVKASEDIGKAFHPESRVSPEQVQVRDFIDKNLRQGVLAGRPAEKSAERLIKGIFQEGEEFSGRQISQKYQILEKAIASSNPEVAALLNQFKTHLGEKLPVALADNLAYRSVLPTFRTKLLKDIKGAIESMKFPPGGDLSTKALLKTATTNLDLTLASIRPENFIEKMRSGEIGKLLRDNVLKESDVLSDYLKLGNLKKIKSQGLENVVKKQYAYDDRIQKFNEFLQNFEMRIENQVAQTELKLAKAVEESQKKLGGKIESTFGTAPPVQSPAAPIPPELRAAPPKPAPIPEIPPIQEPPPIAPPMAEPPIMPPTMNALPRPSPAQQFVPQSAPTLPQAQGLAEGTGDFLEKPLLGGKGVINNPLTKLAGLKYILGKGALPLEAGYAALKGLTSPTEAGAAARQGFKQIGVQAIVQLAEKYPSYHNGIVEDPREKRSLSKEIEDNPEIPAEDKALLQSKIHRGKSIFERI